MQIPVVNVTTCGLHSINTQYLTKIKIQILKSESDFCKFLATELRKSYLHLHKYLKIKVAFT